MRRTYRSKKGPGSGLDHRDVLLTVDEKSSAFDAFYIQNLKQTKRELSCMGSSGQYNPVVSKVRKKKMVRRIVKEVENNPLESISRSTYLTPDKSIRVNKGLDLFDQLLNSSSPRLVAPPMKKDDLFNKTCSGKPAKKYGTRKTRKVKKYNYSSSDSDETDKENESSNVSKNATDIRAHKLIVEKDEPKSPKHQDESIDKIVQNLSLLNNMKNLENSNSPIISFNYSNKRTKQLQAAVLDESILSSTPFKNIRTGTSIYKFSPISRMSYGDKSNYVTITEENDSKIALDCHKLSPVSHFKNASVVKSTGDKILPNFMKVDEINVLKVHVIENNRSKEEKNSCALQNDDINPKKTETKSREVKDLDCLSVLSDSINESDFKVSVGGSKPSELFFGFTVVDQEDELTNVDKLQEKVTIDASKVSINDLSDDNSKISDAFNNSELSSRNSKQITDFIDKIDTIKSDTSMDSKDLESLYDTCNSDKCDVSSSELTKEPVIKVTRLEDAVFQAYYEKMAAYASDLSGDEEMDEESDASPENTVSNDKSYNLRAQSKNNDTVEEVEVDSDDYSNPDLASKYVSDDSNVESEDNYSPQETETDSGSMFEDLESNSNDDDEVRCFVNTRRGVTIKNNSKKLSLVNSSSASSECNKTVLCNTKILVNRISQNEILVSDEDCKNNSDCVESDGNSQILDVVSINLDSDETEGQTKNTDRNSSKRLSALLSSPESSLETKPTIVLQPGKKWERSLSIYRRMTMMNDHFDRSCLENEPLNCKGRKYRQSVISTMEMQEGSLHNESISSRRSTFVVKPCRSTIRILKEPNDSRISLCNSTVYEDLKGFLSDDCDDTIVELSKLSIADSDHEITVVDKLHEDRFPTARDYVLRRCNQTDAILFDECYPDTALKNCHKIGEGVYGEVFLWRARDGRARVMKIVPIAGTTKVNGENQKDFHEIISEIVIAMELSALRAPIAELERKFDEEKNVDALELHTIQNATDVFNEVLAVRCVYGSYTSRLLDLWELYDECKGSENDNPAILPSDQQYIVLELTNAGQDLESYQFNSAEQAHALFLQVAFGLAVGEEAFQFEHRDLHWGNVLIAPTEQKNATFVLRGRAHHVPRRGVAATIIDYSLSRLSLPLAPGDAAALYNDLAADDGLFDAVGDYQFQVYRLMRDKLRNDWKNFEPYTNILWLHYTVDKMITALRYKRTNTKIHKHYISKLKAIKDRILSYGSAVQFVLTDIEY